MKLFSSPTSPYARKVRILIIELGLEDAVAIENTVPMENPAPLQGANPIGKVPTLVLGDGTALYDSPVICEYLDAQHGNRFVPAAGNDRWDCLRRHALAEGVMDAAFLRTMERLRPENEQSALWFERWSNAIMRSLDVMEHEAEILGDRLDLGDITMGCALGYLDLRHGDMNWRGGRGTLADWFETFSARASAKATVPG